MVDYSKLVPPLSSRTLSTLDAQDGALILTVRTPVPFSNLQVLRDDYRFHSRFQHFDSIPPFQIAAFFDGNQVVPASRSIFIPFHQGWNLQFGAGRTWRDPKDPLGVSRIALPFALIEKYANCTHNGVVLFQWNGRQASEGYFQISQETCRYHQFNAWGDLPIQADLYLDNASIQAQRLRWQEELDQRFPVTPWGDFTAKAPHIRMDDGFGRISIEHTTTFGFFYRGQHYPGVCPTRSGNNPFCSEVLLPSFSTAKTSLMGAFYLHLAQKWGTDFGKIRVAPLLRQWAAIPESFEDVTLKDLINMTTGHFISPNYGEDEKGPVLFDFFVRSSLLEKLRYAFGFPYRTPPGTQFAYHTSDTYLLSQSIEELIRRNGVPNFDLFNYYQKLMSDRQLLSDPMRFSLRDHTYIGENTGTAWGGYGLWWNKDSILKIAREFMLEATDANRPNRLFHYELLREAMGFNPNQLGKVTGNRDYTYAYSFWQKKFGPKDGFPCEFVVPFMAGYGGINVVMFPNGVILYLFNDNDEKDWWPFVKQVDKIAPLCNSLERR